MGFKSGNGAKKSAAYILALVAVFAATSVLGLDVKQSLATTLVLALVLGTVLFWEIRLSFALVGTAVLFASGLLNVKNFVEFSALDIIVFLAAMMLFVGFLEKNAFFEFLVSKLLLLLGGGSKRVLVGLLFLAALFAALVDEVTSILFMLSIILHITAKLNVKPLPFVMLVIFATNIGSSATAVGNPVGVIIALNAKLSFADFLRVATPISLAALVAGMAAASLYFRKEIGEFLEKAKKTPPSSFVEDYSGNNRLWLCAALFAGVLVSLVMHAQVESALGLEKNAMLLGTALAAAGIALFLEGRNARNLVETKIDWWTLFFFMLLFASVGALEHSGVMELAAKGFASQVGNNPLVALSAIMGLSGLLSAVLDNVLAVAVFTPLVHDLQATAIGGEYLWWALLFGATLFGNLTIVGSTANIVAAGLVEKRGLGEFKFMEWLKAGAVVVAASVATAFILLYVQLGSLAGG